MKVYVIASNGVDNALEEPYVTTSVPDALTTFAHLFADYHGDPVIKQALLDIAARHETDGYDGCYSDMHDYLNRDWHRASLDFPCLLWEVEMQG